VAVLIPSIDLMDGKIVQLIQGERKVLEFENFDLWVRRFSKYPLVQVIDLDAALQRGQNLSLVAAFAEQLPCQVGGGIRSLEQARSVLDMGAQRVIIGSALFRDGEIDTEFAAQLFAEIGREHLVFAVDSRGGRIATNGWREETSVTPIYAMNELEAWCSGFLYTHIDTEGLMQGIPMETVRRLRSGTSRQLIVAGGIRSHEEIEQLDAINVDAVVGMAIYTEQIKV
jgi:phosphoribosylformimino-5-aminoimidazole carboxamide ribotide isomerase